LPKRFTGRNRGPLVIRDRSIQSRTALTGHVRPGSAPPALTHARPEGGSGSSRGPYHRRGSDTRRSAKIVHLAKLVSVARARPLATP
jgi:hypothetical protein